MRIHRDQPNLTFRKRQRRSGCLPYVLLLGLVVSLFGVSRDWFTQLFNNNDASVLSGDLRRAADAFAEGNLDETIALASGVYDANPDDITALTLLVRALIYRSYVDYDYASDRLTALQLTRTMMSRVLFSRNADVLAIHAFALQANGRSDEAERIAITALELNPEQIVARIALSLAYGQQGLFEAAFREAQEALRLAETTEPALRLDALRVLAISYSDLGKYDEALNVVNRAIQLNRRLIPLYYEHALYASQLGDNDTATASYFQVIAFDNENAKTRLRLCELFSSLRETDLAMRYCNESTDLAPSWSDAWYQLGREFFLQGQYASAQEALNRCTSLQVAQDIPIEERRFECWYLQGQAAEVRGDCPALLAIYSEFREMAVRADLPQTWTYPPEGPPGCALTTPDG